MDVVVIARIVHGGGDRGHGDAGRGDVDVAEVLERLVDASGDAVATTTLGHGRGMRRGEGKGKGVRRSEGWMVRRTLQ